MPFLQIPRTSHYWLKNAHVPQSLLSPLLSPLLPLNADLKLPTAQGIAAFDNLVLVDLEIRDRHIIAIHPPGTDANTTPAVDLRRSLVWPCFVDLHTHLDKGHSWGRAPNTSGYFENAIAVVRQDSERNWDADDVYRRMEFGLKCSYAHGTKAIRTHIDSYGSQANISFGAWRALQEDWEDRLTLQAVSLVTLDYFLTPQGEALADLVAAVGGILGGVTDMSDDLDAQLDRVFTLAKERNLNLDFHTDESGNPADITLRHVAEAKLRHEFTGSVVCGHCCSLAVQPPEEAKKTIDLVKQADIGIVSLPMCNLYLQDRNQRTSSTGALGSAATMEEMASDKTATPRWRGVTLLHELKQAGVPVAIASDNCRDPFYPFGDHDVLEVFTQGARIAHFDAPYGDWSQTVTTTPADLMGLPTIGRIEAGLPADLVVFKARYMSELLSRPQGDRIVIRDGQPIDTTLPDYATLDGLVY